MKRIRIWIISCLMLLFCATIVHADQLGEFNLDPEEIIKTWIFSRADIRGPGNGRLDWCPDKSFFLYVVYYKNPNPEDFLQEVTIILNMEKKRPEGIVWYKGETAWMFERFCQEDWVRRLPEGI